MKKFLILTLAALSMVCSAQTKTPIQLLNPAGSASGQAIVSTGPSTAPYWGNIGAGSLSPIAANSLLGNATGSSASPAAVPVPSCSTSSSALRWTSASGFNCNTAINASTLGSATFAAPGAIGSTTPGSGAFTTLSTTSTATLSAISTSTATISGGTINGTSVGATTASTGRFTTVQATSLITPSSTSGIVGTSTNDNAVSGSWGEYASNSTSGTSLTSSTSANCTSISLTAGDWDVSGTVFFSPAGSTTISSINAGVSTTSGTLPAQSGLASLYATLTTGNGQSMMAPISRVSIASTTTVYMVGQSTFGTSTMTCNGFIRARRVR
ncbi:hypothetical protein ACJBUE_22445 (plasmid) [Ralstonia syzygii subsp. celebesensis]|uniref:Hemagglutinin n=1 Tax=blood disease bacterium A2-HR MARDI TaxID=1944648 RepID=A0A1U9VPV3_9RALS|nr:hypothetical protein [Ralstonia syzygii]AQW32724.1 hypothetical protein B0B51_23385 [blood disease bacterium A2-HR MARDI]QQV57694.1 hypothetical protein JK151_19795 [Ralstonia syzygii subsp. celebesensis]